MMYVKSSFRLIKRSDLLASDLIISKVSCASLVQANLRFVVNKFVKGAALEENLRMNSGSQSAVPRKAFT